ncbi:Peptidase S1 domain-containing protein [Caenorhabditis elegans]|nr:Peptidase S1 domain-containing protein [Caenorhabditis elegans]VAY52522.1 Peptidase S1 domain-containing protein [Caenorhabditis elegans]|eukprot:NP_001355438.1 TRYpsin-like protease [Caenorhabditis elegans]
MNFFILLLSFISYSTSIINGFSANSFDTLSLASVITRFPDGTTNVCGGVLIAPSIVITSAHCVFSGDDFAVTAKVTLGDVHLNKHDDGEQEFRSHAMAISKKFFNDASEANDDVAVIFLPQRADVCHSPLSLQIAKLPSTGSVNFKETAPLTQLQLETSVCYVAGWGKTENKTAKYSDSVRQMMVNLSVRRIGKRKYLIAKAVTGSSRACMGDSGSPVYCFVNGKRILVGTVAHIGSFSKMSEQDPSNHISFCRDFEYTFVSDWRESSERVVEILQKYGELYQLNEGQNMCFGSGIF